jgi:hypothetical protein
VAAVAVEKAVLAAALLLELEQAVAAALDKLVRFQVHQ